MENQENQNLEEKVTLTVSQVLEDLQNGLTRTPKHAGYDPEKGSISEKYELKDVDVKALFQHPKLKGKRTIFEKKEKAARFVLVDDTVTESQEVEGNLLED